MQDAHSVITSAASGHVGDMAREMEVGDRRMYEILGKDNPYPKAKRLVRVIGKFNKQGVREIKADFNAMIDDVLGDDVPRVPSVREIHKEAFDVIDAELEGKPPAEQKQQIRELIAVLNLKLEGIERFESRNGLAPVA